MPGDADNDLQLSEAEYEPVALENLPSLTALPVIVPSWWGAEDMAVQAAIRAAPTEGSAEPYRGYHVEAAGEGKRVSLSATPVYPDTLSVRAGDEPVADALLDVSWSTEPGRLRGSALVPITAQPGTAAGVTVVAHGLSRASFRDVLRSLRALGA